MIRIVAPAEQAGFRLIRGTDWDNDTMQVFPDRVTEADIVLIQRDFPGKVAEYEEVMAQARSRGKFIAYELDDLLSELPYQHPDYDYYRVSRPAIIRAIVEADAVIGSTPSICDYMRQFNSNAWELPNYLDDRLWRLESIQKTESEALIVGFMGGHSHSYDLETIVPPLLRVLDRYSDRSRGIHIILKFWGLEPPAAIRSWPNVEWINIGFVDYRAFVNYFLKQKCDIFLAPLQDNLFNHCKSQLKFLEYSALGVPGIYSRVTPYQRIVLHGKSGFLASSPAEWEESMIQLIENPSLRSQMGTEAQSTVCTQWMLSKHIQSWKELHESFILAPDTRLGLVQPRNRGRQIPPIAGLNKFSKNALRKIQTFHTDLEKQLADQATSLRSLSEALKQALDRVENLQAQLTEMELLRAQVIERDRAALEAEKAAQQYYGLYHDILNTNSWKLMEVLAKLRSKLVPRGSQRESISRLILHFLGALKKEGLRASIHVVKNEARVFFERPTRIDTASATKRQFGELKFTPLTAPALATTRCPLPAVSILMIKEAGTPQIGTQEILDWVHGQTYPSIANLVIWDRATKLAQLFDHSTEHTHPTELAQPGACWYAPDFKALCQNLKTRYICFASDDLIHQDAAYLETNLIALETESLAFTVNLRGHADWAIRLLEQGYLPGSETLPMLREVVMRECIGDDLSLDLSAWLEKWNKFTQGTKSTAELDFPVVAGKIILHTSSRDDQENSFPFKQRFSLSPEQPKIGFIVQGRNILIDLKEDQLLAKQVQRESYPGLNKLSYSIVSIGSLVPAQPAPTNLPTVIVVMPFLAVGGAEQVALKVMQQLKEQIRFAVVTFETHDPALGTTADAFRKITPYVYTIPDFLHESQYYSFMDYLVERLRPHTLYIANGTTWIYNALGEIKQRYPALRIVDQVYDAEVGWINRYDFPVVLYTDGHIGVNSKICQAYIKKGADPERVYLIENGIDPGELNPADYPDDKVLQLKEKLGLNQGNQVVSFASRLHPQKRPMDFIELARRFSSDSSVDFLMVGDGPLATVVNGQIQKLGLKNIHRCQFYQPISDILALTDVLVLPSEFEGMPMIVIEAQAMGKPVVVTDVGNNRQIIERTSGGIVVPRIGEVSALMQAMKEMLNAPPDSGELRRATLSHFDIRLVAEKYLKALLGDSHAGQGGFGQI